MLNMLNKKIVILVILFLGLLLRVINIQNNPVALYGDELTITLDSYSLFKTGHDQLGNLLPITFEMGAGRPAGYVYGSIPFIALFGPSALGVRSLSILSGLGVIFLLYLIGRKLFSKKVGILAAAITAVSPWDISLSRGGFEAHFALFLALIGIYLFITARYKPILYIFSALSFGLTFHTYPTYKVSILMFLPLLLWYQGEIRQLVKRKDFLIGVMVLIVSGLVSLSQTFTAGSEARFSDINIFSQSKLKDSIEQKINFERQIIILPQSLSKIFHNKPAEYTKVWLENYLQNFSMDFLVLHGDRNPRHNMATMGEIYFVEMISITIGLLVFWVQARKTIIFLILWILLAPIPTAVIDLPHALRSSFMLPPLIILSALGLTVIFNQRSKIFIPLILLLFMTQFLFFIQKLYFLAPLEYSNFWSYPARLASQTAIQNKDKYNYVILSDKIDNIEFAYPVYGKVEPAEIISQNRSKTVLDNYQFKKWENVYMGYLPDSIVDKFLADLDGSVLYIGSIGDKDSLQDYETVAGSDNIPALILKRKP